MAYVPYLKFFTYYLIIDMWYGLILYKIGWEVLTWT